MNDISQPVAVAPTDNASATPSTRAEVSPVLLACCLALGPATAIGFGRFAYALVLPAMRTDLHLSYQQAGTLNTANMVGYLLGALLTTRVANWISPRTTLLAGLAASIVALFMAGYIESYSGLMICRALVGMAAAFTFIASTSLAAHLGRNEDESALALGLAIGGPGVGSIIAGLTVPFILASPEHWPLAWRTLGGIGILAFIVVLLGTRSMRSHSSSSASQGTTQRSTTLQHKADFRPLIPTLASYFLFGLGYIAYMTFLVAYVQGLGASPSTVAIVWSSLGAAMVASAFVWRHALAHERSGRTMAYMGFGGAIAAALPLLSSHFLVLLVSAIVFGLTMMPIFTAVTLLIRRFLPPAAWANAIAVGTVIFAAGQSLGPIGSGSLSDIFGSKASIIWSLVVLLIAAVVAWMQKPAPENLNS